jgi:hypothetical protein
VEELVYQGDAHGLAAAVTALAEERAASASWNATADESAIPAPERST